MSRLHVPEGYEVEYRVVREAHSMTSGYQQAMESSDAKYKIYLHQDVFVVNPNVLYELLGIFQNLRIGMVGVIGSPRLPVHGVPWYGDRVGTIYTSNTITSGEVQLPTFRGDYQEVEGVDGLFMATQYDIPWREDLFTRWDFYDLSQSQEFLGAGYQVVVPAMDKPWVIHDDGYLNLEHYYEERKIFLKEYKGIILE